MLRTLPVTICLPSMCSTTELCCFHHDNSWQKISPSGQTCNKDWSKTAIRNKRPSWVKRHRRALCKPWLYCGGTWCWLAQSPKHICYRASIFLGKWLPLPMLLVPHKHQEAAEPQEGGEEEEASACLSPCWACLSPSWISLGEGEGICFLFFLSSWQDTYILLVCFRHFGAACGRPQSRPEATCTECQSNSPILKASMRQSQP